MGGTFEDLIYVNGTVCRLVCSWFWWQALLLPTALAPRANAGSTDYWDSEYPLGLCLGPAPELLSQAQGVLINQPLTSDNLALNVGSGGPAGGFQPFQVDALLSWTGATSRIWSTSTNWSPWARQAPPIPPSSTEHLPISPLSPEVLSIGTLSMTTGVAQNVAITASSGTFFITGQGILGTGVLVDNPNAFTLTIAAKSIDHQ